VWFWAATIITDDWSGCATFGKRGYLHTAVAERGDMQVAETFLPIIHLVFCNLKTWLRGIHPKSFELKASPMPQSHRSCKSDT
jgi:hypothetical protein